MVDVVITFLAILALVALALTLFLVVAGRRPGVVAGLGAAAIPLAWLVATVSTLGSLFLSEVAGFIPCTLCWVQRGFMYPLAVVLALPRIRKSIPAWVGWWSLAGSLVSIFHYLEQRWPSLAGADFCSPSVPCSTIWVDEFGFVTIPFMAMSGFWAIAALVALGRRWRSEVSINRELVYESQ
jgi:disulfide bond formation protein DsbB